MISALVAVLISSSLAAAQTSNCARTYTVQDGDYCDKISAANNVSTYQLAVSNYQTINEACTNLDVGESICLGATGADCQTTYVVQAGDYCDLIAGNFGINTTLLYSNNPNIDDATCANLYEGEVLCVANTSLVTAPPTGWAVPGSALESGSTGDDATTDATDDTTVDAPVPVAVAVSSTFTQVVPTTSVSSTAAPATSTPATDDSTADTTDTAAATDDTTDTTTDPSTDATTDSTTATDDTTTADDGDDDTEDDDDDDEFDCSTP